METINPNIPSTKMTQMNLPETQRKFCKTMKMSFTDAYTYAFDQIFMKNCAKLEKKKALEDELNAINKSIEEDKNKKFSLEETLFLKDTNLDSRRDQLVIRFNVFRKQFHRDFMELNEFIESVAKAKVL